MSPFIPLRPCHRNSFQPRLNILLSHSYVSLAQMVDRVKLSLKRVSTGAYAKLNVCGVASQCKLLILVKAEFSI